MIPNDLRGALVEKLIDVPGVGLDGNRDGRTALLLAGIPNTGFFNRNSANARGDVLVLVLQLEETFGPAGEWRLLQLVSNALLPVQGTELGTHLLKIRTELENFDKGTRPVRVNAAELAQVHLFDLRRPVGMCIGMLPATAKTSGFVVPTPTSKLMDYFCDSLKYNGEGQKTWSRDQVATTGKALVIDPKHTAVSVALNKMGNVRSLLAKKHVIWPIYVENFADAAVLWQELKGTFGRPLDHHLVIAMGMPEGTETPAGMIPLPSPQFTSKDVSNWVTEIGKALAWQEAVVNRWASVILMDYGGDPDDLPIEMVYEQLEMHSRLLTQYRTQDELAHALEDLERMGA